MAKKKDTHGDVKVVYGAKRAEGDVVTFYDDEPTVEPDLPNPSEMTYNVDGSGYIGEACEIQSYVGFEPKPGEVWKFTAELVQDPAASSTVGGKKGAKKRRK